MPDFDVRADSVDVRELMEQIRARIREKRGVDYTEQQLRELAAVKLEKFLDPRAVRSDLLQQFRTARSAQFFVPFGPDPLFTAQRPLVARLRRWLRPVLRLFFNPDPITEAFARVNYLATIMKADQEQHYELLHNLVLELTRTSIEVRNLKVRVDSLSSRLDFDEQRARALEHAVVYRPDRPASAESPDGPGTRNRRLRQRRWRRGEAAAAMMNTAPKDSERPAGSPEPHSVNPPPAGADPNSDREPKS